LQTLSESTEVFIRRHWLRLKEQGDAGVLKHWSVVTA
jgi:hypothetical protein